MVTKENIATWGVTSTCDGVAGIVTSIRVQSNGLFQPETDYLGAVCCQVLYDVHYQVVVQIVCGRETEVPSIGDTVSIAGEAYIVKSVAVIETNTAYKKMQLIMESYLKCSEAEVNTGE